MSDQLDFRAISDETCDGRCQRAVARLDLDSGGHVFLCGHHTRLLPLDLEAFSITYATVTL